MRNAVARLHDKHIFWWRWDISALMTPTNEKHWLGSGGAQAGALWSPKLHCSPHGSACNGLILLQRPHPAPTLLHFCDGTSSVPPPSASPAPATKLSPIQPRDREPLRWAGYNELIRGLTAQGTKSQPRSQSRDRDIWRPVLPHCSPCGHPRLQWDAPAQSNSGMRWETAPGIEGWQILTCTGQWGSG